MAHHPQHDHKHGDPAAHSKRRGLHKDWRTWLVVLLMLGAMAIYVMSGDECAGPSGAPMPAAPGPAAGP